MDSIIPLRHCNKCNNDWPLTAEYFFADKRTGSGFRFPCKQCIKDYRQTPIQKETIQASVKKHYRENADKIKQYVRTYQSEHREEVRAFRRRHYALHREEHQQRSRKYRAEHREERLQYQRQYRNLHREEYRQYNRKSSHKRYALQPERFHQYGRQYYANHREKMRLYGRQYHYLHRERRLLYNNWYDATHKNEKHQYHVAHREENRVYAHQRRVRQMAIPGILTTEQIQEKLKQQHYRCYYAACGFSKFDRCNGRYVFHVEHTVPVSRLDASPRHDINFVVLSCPRCNLRKGAKLPHEWPEGNRLL